MDFAAEIDAAITKAKSFGVDKGEMVADLQGALDGLKEEIEADQQETGA